MLMSSIKLIFCTCFPVVCDRGKAMSTVSISIPKDLIYQKISHGTATYQEKYRRRNGCRSACSAANAVLALRHIARATPCSYKACTRHRHHLLLDVCRLTVLGHGL